MFSVVNVYHDHLKFYVVCIDGRRYVCCSECDVVSNECNEPTSCLVQPIGAHCCEVMYFRCFGFRGELGFLNCDNVCMSGRLWSVCEVVVVPYVDAVVAVTVMRVLLFVLHVCMLRECEGARLTAMLGWGMDEV